MEASSVENTETLQEMWAGLLATASQQDRLGITVVHRDAEATHTR
jgi:hypothetical protein